MSNPDHVARMHGHGPCTWCGRELLPTQRPAPPSAAEAEVNATIMLGGRMGPSPCTRCGRLLEVGQASDPDRDPTANGSQALGELRVAYCKVCTTPIAVPAAKGRPPSYCSPACSAEARRKRQRKGS